MRTEFESKLVSFSEVKKRAATPRSFDELLHEAIRDFVRPEKMFREALVAELDRQEVRLSAANLEALEAEVVRVLAKPDDKMKITVDESVNPHLTIEQLESRTRDILGAIGQSIPKYLETVRKAITETVKKTGAELALDIHRQILKRRSRVLRQLRRERSDFCEQIADHWTLAIDALQCELESAIEARQSFLNRAMTATNHRGGKRMREVLLRLHARGCQIANEIVLLLSHGYADGAHARWRSLHEVACIAWFIESKGERTALRYMQHEAINRSKLAKSQADAWPEYARMRAVRKGLQNLQSESTKLAAKFGPRYGTDYGWSIPNFKGKSANFVPTFRDIEEAVRFNVVRPHYVHANLNVHAGAFAMHYRLGLSSSSEDHPMLDGPSPFGLEDPGMLTANTLLMLSVPLLTSVPSFEGNISLHVLSLLANDAKNRFLSGARRAQREWLQLLTISLQDGDEAPDL